ncbi:RNA-guided endonuclease IscB [Ligilactobacillus equi]|uniref:Paclitaxel taxanoid biosynthesis susceptibility protein ts1 n=1 Tax=Ligilactobacillus equi DSM 15833 = JCM 10991 TaxID=1423740 RepID=A0A0R1TSL1_9LACO|nr:RNA-guided endonuclease IscB [Ligilactobacillus equi]KRL84351.1 paclitaxel taxanoid biosynthesis susceptibility protein ts1 [Ligilactobacillus equi DSM 15833 = JCM 10991]
MPQKKVEYIYVVDSKGEPVMPTSRLGMVRRWLKSGQAIWYGNSRKTIQFVRPITTNTQELTLGVDAGFHLGLSVVSVDNQREYYASESVRDSKREKEKLEHRRDLRRGRRNRLRHRKKRFKNRKRQKKSLAPSVQHLLDFTIREIKRLYEFLPISKLVVEVAPFDNQKLANPNIKPWEYTQGRMHGFKSVKDYLLARDGYRDALDGKVYPASQLRVHHLVQRKDGGTNQPDNLVLLSDVNHNQANHVDGTLAKLAAERQTDLNTNYRGAYFMSVLAKRLPTYFANYIQTQGYITANLRTLYGIEKSHRNDAFIIAGGTDTCLRTSNIYSRTKVANNNRVLQKFYDARYIDSRDGKIKPGKKLSSGRTKRSRELDYKNQRIYRQEKVTKGRVSIRRNHYQLRPHDIVLNTKTNRIETVRSVVNRGKSVVFQTGKSTKPTNVRCLHHINGLREEKM